MDFRYQVSVVVPVYNAEAFLDECVTSLLKQKHMKHSDYEIILVNDGSKDSSEAICQSYASQYDNITYIYKENSGVSDTRNLGISKAQGKYILLLDSDDYLGETSLSALSTFFDAHYDEIDLCTYPLYYANEKGTRLHQRYSVKHYDKGSDVYDLTEYTTQNQSTINIFFKNLGEDTPRFNSKMRLSEDQYFDTCMLMRKKKIGFVADAAYYYRTNSESVSRTINNPYYCFEEIISYNEKLLTQFNENGVIPKYVQNLVLSTLTWRLKSDMLLPYHLEGEAYEQGVARIRGLIEKLDNSTIIEFKDSDRFFKVFFLDQKKEKLSVQPAEEGYSIVTDAGEIVCDVPSANLYLRRTTTHGNQVTMNLFAACPIDTIVPIDHLIVKVTDGSHNVKNCEIPLQASRIPLLNSKTPVARQYPASFTFDITNTTRLDFSVRMGAYTLPVNIRVLHQSNLRPNRHVHGKKIGDYRFTLVKGTHFTVTPYTIKQDLRRDLRLCLMEKKRPLTVAKLFYTRGMAELRKERIWLYVDSPKVIDNAFYQYVHDFEKKDGVDRYYVAHDDDTFVREKMTPEQASHIVMFQSEKHMELFMKAEKVLVSFSSNSIYNPLSNYFYYSDKVDYELIYLQHGILHASLPFMYGKTYSDISRFVISSEFEKQNLIQNYDYRPEDLIMTGMPRFTHQMEIHPPKGKVLFAPSWRQYLIGPLVNNGRVLRTADFLKSDWFLRINEFLHSPELSQLLEEYHMTLEFKLHPIFKPYEEHFDLENVKNVSVNYSEAILDEYDMFITDFSSFQFDYLRLVRPVAYFLPDKKEFRSGIHSYRSLDLKYEDAFGPLFETADQLLEFMKDTFHHHFEVASPYKERMENFYSYPDDPCEALYQELMK